MNVLNINYRCAPPITQKLIVKNKQAGSAILAVVLILAAVCAFLSFSATKYTQAAVNSTTSNKITIQAQQYAVSKADIVKALPYSSLSNQTRSDIPGSSGFMEEVIIGTESAYPANPKIMQKECTIRIYKGSESLARSSIRFMRYSVETSSVPQGTILPWYGASNSVPVGFVICDGSNGTPDLRDKFLVGAGNSYSVGSTGGEAFHVLTVDELANHTHYQATNNGVEQVIGREVGVNLHSYFPDIPAQGYDYGDGAGPIFVSPAGNSQPHENRPPYYALLFIMKE